MNELFIWLPLKPQNCQKTHWHNCFSSKSLKLPLQHCSIPLKTLLFCVFSFQDYLFNHVSFFSWCVFSGIMGSFITHDFSCLSRVGLLVHDHTDTILSSYTFKSHYLLTESNRAELMKLPMIPSSSSATKKNIGKGKIMFSWFM